MPRYILQTRVANPEVVAQRSGRSHRWIDQFRDSKLAPLKVQRQIHQRIIKICAKGEQADLVDVQAYPGRRFRVMVAEQAPADFKIEDIQL